MKINRATLPANKDEVFEEEIDFSNQKFDENHVKRILSCSVRVVAHEYGVFNAQLPTKLGVPASNLYGKSLKVVLSKVTRLIISPPP